ncbi:MAG TPA: signal recognition particle-docking protein FtsY [Thermomicrobiaceae bacterium]|nr:signal recognition particle-docking protein FtsY [Thermomicrobiaceae bacterium]
MVFGRLFRRKTEPEPKIEAGLKKTRRGLFQDISKLFERSEITEDLYEDLEALLIQADLGVETTVELLDNLRARIDRERIRQPAEAREALRTEMIALLEHATRNRRIKIYQRGVPFAILVVGVNGTGKTTTIAKLARLHQDAGRTPVLVAGDTFRAAAIDQLKVWGERLGATVIAHDPGADPGAVVFDGMQAAYNRKADILLIDTAGRLHTKFNLMEELKKIKKVIQRHVAEAPQEVLLVIDATTGQNGLVQAKKFAEAAEITDIAIAKLDGTSRGGIAFAISRELGIPISYVGTGEKVTDLAEFNPETYVDALFFGDEDLEQGGA